MKKSFPLLVLSLFLATGCFLGPMVGTKSGSKSNTESTAGEQNATVVREGLNTSPINISAAEGAVVSVDIPQNEIKAKIQTQGKQTTELEESESFFSKKKLPLTLSIIFFGIGLIIVCIGIWLLRKSFASVDAAVGVADRSFASGINMVESWLAASTDHQENAKLSALKAQFEKERGKLNNRR